MLGAIEDRRIRTKLAETITSLSQDPERRGKALIGELQGYRSIRAVGQRYRIVYQVDGSSRRVTVVAVGIRRGGSRKDVYAVAQKVRSLGVL
jgi:mRNA interferase RelE/StbE